MNAEHLSNRSMKSSKKVQNDKEKNDQKIEPKHSSPINSHLDPENKSKKNLDKTQSFIDKKEITYHDDNLSKHSKQDHGLQNTSSFLHHEYTNPNKRNSLKPNAFLKTSHKKNSMDKSNRSNLSDKHIKSNKMMGNSSRLFNSSNDEKTFLHHKKGSESENDDLLDMSYNHAHKDYEKELDDMEKHYGSVGDSD